MARCIYKYKISEIGTTLLPKDAEVLHVDYQMGNFCVWVTTDPANQDMVETKIQIVPTGGEVPASGFAEYLGTVLTDGGRFVWHIFKL